MAVKIELKRSAVPGKTPTITDLQLGELAINTYDGKVYFKKDVSGVQTIVEIASASGSIATSSFAQYAAQAGYATSSGFATSASHALNTDNAISSSYAFSSSYAVSASHAPTSVTASYALTSSYSFTSSFAATASSADDFFARGNITGSNALITGTLTVQTIVAQVITSSTEFITGSTKFGSQLTDTHQFTGSVTITGSLAVNGEAVITTGSYNTFSSSIAGRATNLESTASVLVAASASFSSSIALLSGSFLQTSASYASASGSLSTRVTNLETTASVLTTASASFALVSASYSAASQSLSTRTTNLESTASILTSASASFAQDSGSNSIRLTNLEATASVLTAASASFSSSIALLSGSFLQTSASLSGSIALLSGSFLQTSASLSSSIALLSGSFLTFSSSYTTASFTGSFTGIGNLTGSFSGNFSGSFSGTITGSIGNIKGTPTYIPVFDSANSIATSSIYQVGDRSVAINITNVDIGAPEALLVSQPNTSSYNVIGGRGNLNNYLQLNIKNTNQGVSASSDIVATANNGDESSFYIDMGINSENYAQNFIGAANDAYLYSIANNLHIGNAATGSEHLGFFVGGSDVYADTKLQLNTSNLHELTGSLNISSSLIVNQGITGSLYGTSSWAIYALTASTTANVQSASYAATASSADDFLIRGNVTASNALINGTLTAITIVAQYITSSTEFITGSTKFGSLLTDTHQFTGSVTITGSLAVNGEAVITTGSYNTFSASIAGRATNLESTASVLTTASASFALVSSSYSAASQSLSTRTTNLESTASTLVAASASFAIVSASYSSASGSLSTRVTTLENASASFAQQSGSNSIRLANLETTASVLTTASASFALVSSSFVATSASLSSSIASLSGSFLTFSSSYTTASFTGSFTGIGNLTGSLYGTASWAVSASHAPTSLSSSYAISASYAATASSSDQFFVRTSVTASDALITGTLTAQTIVAQYITSSTEFITGSTKFGSLLTNTHQFTGSVTITGSLAVNGDPVITSSSYNVFSSSIAGRATNLEATASTLTTASASFALVSSSYASASGSLSTRVTNLESTASVLTTASASFAVVSSSFASTSASISSRVTIIEGNYATTGSNIFVGNQTVTGSLFTTGSNTLIGNTQLTGGLNITGSTVQIGSNTLLGNTTLSGSIIISGSTQPGSPTASVQIYGDIRQTGYHRFDPVTTNIDQTISASYIYVSGSTNDLYFTQNGAGYANTTRLRWLEGNLYTGLLNGGLITTQSSTVYQISSGSGIIVDLNASLNDNPYPVVQYLNWSNLSASIAPLTASYQQAFVGIDSTGNIFQQGTPFSNGQFDVIINIGNVLFQNQSTINGVKTQPSVAYGFEQAQNVFNRAFGPLKLSGYTLSPSGSSTGSLIVGSGTAYAPGSNYTIDPNEPYYTVDSGTNVSKIFRYYDSGSTWVYLTNAGAGYETIDPSQYSNNGTLSSVGAGNWSIQRVFWFPNSVTKAIVVYYGNAIYATEAEAIANLNIESFVEAPNTAANAIYLGAVVISGNGVFTNTNTFTILPGGLFRQVGGSGGGGSVITQTLTGLSDVNISGPTDYQPFVYSATQAKWINASFASASISGNAATATTASFAQTASFVLNAVSASYAATASSADSFLIRQNATASNLLVNNTITATTLVVQTVSSSVVYSSGSNIFGNSLSNTQQFTGSVTITGSLAVNGEAVVTTGSYNTFSSSIAGRATRLESTASVLTTASASFALVSSSYSSASGSLSTRVTNLESTASTLTTASASFALVSSSYSAASQSLSTRTTNLESTASTLTAASASFAQQSGSNSTRLTNLESTASVLTTASASFALVSASYSSASGSLSTRVTNLESTASTLTTASASFAVVSSSYSAASQSLSTRVTTLEGRSATTGSNVFSGSQVITGSLTVTGSINASQGVTASLFGTASWALNAVTSSYILNAVSASFAATASSVNTLNQNVLITGSLTVGLTSVGSNENTLIVGPSPAGGSGEGGQILLAAVGGTYTSASMLDNYQNKFRILRGTNASSDAYKFQLDLHTGQLQFPNYNSSTAFVGTPVSFLAVDSNGNVLTSNSVVSASYALSASFAQTASYVLNAVSASFAATASSADNFLIRQNATASNLLVNNTITAQTLVVQTVTSSIVYSSGSNIFGNQLTDVQQMTGSLRVTGSGNHYILGGNLGLDIASPTAKLDLAAGSGTSQVGLRIRSLSTNSNGFNIVTNSSTDEIYLNNFYNAAMLFGTNNTEKMRIAAGGNVGINDTNPQYKLSVAGDANITANLTATGSIRFPSLSNANQVNVVGYNTSTGQLFYQTTSSLSVSSASYAATSSYAVDFTVKDTLTLGGSLMDYASIASSTIGANNLFTQASGSYRGAIYSYTAASASNARTGQVMAVWNAGSVQYTDNSTVDIGSTTAVTASVAAVTGDIQFNIQTNTGGWAIRSTVTYL